METILQKHPSLESTQAKTGSGWRPGSVDRLHEMGREALAGLGSDEPGGTGAGCSAFWAWELIRVDGE